ncbi:hypothetical protein ACSRUE_12865 [Sorangium sp. KYC3313]
MHCARLGTVRSLYSGVHAEAEEALSLPVSVGEVLARLARAAAQVGDPG